MLLPWHLGKHGWFGYMFFDILCEACCLHWSPKSSKLLPSSSKWTGPHVDFQSQLSWVECHLVTTQTQEEHEVQDFRQSFSSCSDPRKPGGEYHQHPSSRVWCRCGIYQHNGSACGNRMGGSPQPVPFYSSKYFMFQWWPLVNCFTMSNVLCGFSPWTWVGAIGSTDPGPCAESYGIWLLCTLPGVLSTKFFKTPSPLSTVRWSYIIESSARIWIL